MYMGNFDEVLEPSKDVQHPERLSQLCSLWNQDNISAPLHLGLWRLAGRMVSEVCGGLIKNHKNHQVVLSKLRSGDQVCLKYHTKLQTSIRP